MATTLAQQQSRIDDQMEQVSTLLIQRQYFEAEKQAVIALRRALGIQDYDRTARICLPLQEARRQKREMAIDAGAVFLIDAEMPTAEMILPGCYLIAPPRVGVDGRLIREMGDERRVPIVTIVREPATREGMWPLVAVGPTTVRARVDPPRAPKPVKPEIAKSGGAKRKTLASGVEHAAREMVVGEVVSLPPPEWFVVAAEALGDAAIASCGHVTSPELLVEALALRLAACPEHEKLHQRLQEAARAAAREPSRRRRAGAAHRNEDDEFLPMNFSAIDEPDQP